MWPPEGLSAPSPLLIGWSLGPPQGAAGASAHLPQAAPKAPQGTGGQGAITQATSPVPRGVSLEGPLPTGLMPPWEEPSRSLWVCTERSPAAPGKASAPGGLRNSRGPRLSPFCAPRQWSQKPGLFLQTCVGITPPSSKGIRSHPYKRAVHSPEKRTQVLRKLSASFGTSTMCREQLWLENECA